MLVTTAVPAFGIGKAEAKALRNPRVADNGIVTWDCIEFGHYTQSSEGSENYKTEKIKWRVLHVENGEALLLADKNLDTKPYNNKWTNKVTWEDSTVRSWLNGYGKDFNKDGTDYINDNFLDTAFTEQEQKEIYQKDIQTPDSLRFGTEGGNDTKDKIFLLSEDEIMNPDYGFPSDADMHSKARRAVNTEYAKYRGASTITSEEEYLGNGNWWLRSPGKHDDQFDDSMYVDNTGQINREFNCITTIAIRPALCLKLNSDSWSYAGTVSSDGTVSNGEKVKVTDLTLNSIQKSLYVGQQCALKAKVMPSNADNKNVIWKSQNEAVATVTKVGTVKAVGEGNTIIQAMTEDHDFVAECNITVQKPRTETESLITDKLNAPGQPTTWDCVWFGHYPQSRDGNDGYKEEPIKWRVLAVNGDEALLLADQNLDVKKYNEKETDITWEMSTIRSWLNGYGEEANQSGYDYTSKNFISKAFTTREKAAIYEKKIENVNNTEYGTEGGNDTKDKIFFLSLNEVTNPNYGLFLDTNMDNKGAGQAANTDYAQSRRVEIEETTYSEIRGSKLFPKGGQWWLRSPGNKSTLAAFMTYSGSRSVIGNTVSKAASMIRPALRLNLKSDSWSYAGTVSSDGKIEEIADSQGNVSMKRPTNPKPMTMTTWDCVWFGRYPQSSDGDGGFHYDPIKWRILSIEGNEALLLADKGLDARGYHEAEQSDVTWEVSKMRKWLNGTGSGAFLGKAFTAKEQEYICQSTVQNAAGSLYEIGGNSNFQSPDTQDKVFLLSADECMNLDYGFSNISWNTDSRNVVLTEYAGEKDRTRWWWLRSPDDIHRMGFTAVIFDGGGIGGDNNDSIRAVRPALHLNLNSDVWSYAGTVCSDGTVDEKPSPILDRITATKTKTVYKTNETLTTNDLTITAFYSDATSKNVTDYTTNVAAIDMTTAGNKTLEVTYEENGVAKTATVRITVAKADMPPASEPTQQMQDDEKDPKPTKPVDQLNRPKKVTLKKATSTKKGTLKLTWKKDTKATGYQAMVATDKKFKKNKKAATIKKNKTVTKTFTKLKRGKTYFAKVRAYKKIGKKNVYGAYSKVKKAKVK